MCQLAMPLGRHAAVFSTSLLEMAELGKDVTEALEPVLLQSIFISFC